MTRTPAETFARHYDSAAAEADSWRASVAQAATEGQPASEIVNKLNKLAEAEGSRDMWYRLQRAATHTSVNGDEFTEDMANRVVLGFLANGADDSWSGRGNDVRRAYFDGIREASRKIELMFS